MAEAALGYANALAAGNARQAWGLLSSPSRAGMTETQWQRALESARTSTVPRQPPASAVLRAVASAEATVGEVLVRAGEAFIAVTGSVEVSQTLALVKESEGWKVDLEATDRLNGRQAALDFLEVIRQETQASAPGAPRRGQEASLPLLRSLLSSEAKNYRVVEAEFEGDRAEVTVAAEVPVSLVLRAARSGAGWSVDLTRPLLPVDITTREPIKQAAIVLDKMGCEEQLRQLVRAIQMYASASDDMLPDPDRWLQQIRPYLTLSGVPRCPSDSEAGISYAMNRNLAGKRLRRIASPGMVVLLYESTKRGANPADAGEGWPRPARHLEGNLVAYADGSVRPAAIKPSFEVKEGPPSPAGPARGGATPSGQPKPQMQGPGLVPTRPPGTG